MDTNTLLLVLGPVAVVVLFQRLIALRARLSRLEGKIDAILRASGIDYDPLATVPVAVREALEQGEYILAIKRLREATGVGLKEAKYTIDELRRRRADPAGTRA
ncbi:MAG: hypothetical protein FJ276_36565 [Planctomycetes bacterium]|nr:hypothetical protein [Planctomycetota bacterium]